MKDGNNILYKFFLWWQFFIVYHQYRCVEFHAESFKPVVSKTDKSVFMRDHYGFDLLLHDFVQ